MIKIIAALLLSLMPLMAMESKAHEVEMYPDEMPKIKLVFQGKIPEECFDLERKWLGVIFSKIGKHIQETFAELGFKEIWLDPTYWNSFEEKRRENHLFCRINHDSILDSAFIFFDIKRSSELSNIKFEKLPCRVHESVYTKEKWNYPRKLSRWHGEFEEAIEHSWKYIDLRIHSQPNLDRKGEYFPENLLEKTLYENIRIKGFENTIIRAMFIFDDEKNEYSWNFIYNTKDDLHQGNNIIVEIPNTFNKKDNKNTT